MPESTVRTLTSQEIHCIAQGAFRAGADAATKRAEWNLLNERVRAQMLIDGLLAERAALRLQLDVCQDVIAQYAGGVNQVEHAVAPSRPFRFDGDGARRIGF